MFIILIRSIFTENKEGFLKRMKKIFQERNEWIRLIKQPVSSSIATTFGLRIFAVTSSLRILYRWRHSSQCMLCFGSASVDVAIFLLNFESLKISTICSETKKELLQIEMEFLKILENAILFRKCFSVFFDYTKFSGKTMGHTFVSSVYVGFVLCI